MMSKSNKQAWKVSVLQRAATELARLGFDQGTQGHRIVKKATFGRVALVINFYDREATLGVTAGTELRFEDVENFVNKTRHDLRENEKKRTSTFGGNLGRIHNGQEAKWAVSSADLVLPVAQRILEMFVDVGCPFLTKYSDRTAALELLRGRRQESKACCPIPYAAGIRAVALAYLDRRHDVQEVIVEKRAELMRIGQGLEDFEEFVASIDAPRQ